MTEVEHKSDFELTKDTPYLTLIDELCDDFRENWLHYTSFVLYKSRT